MTQSPLILKKLDLIGPNKPAASIEFDSGLNVICGASDTGKSFIVEALDFLLGGTGPLRDIPERIGYDRARLAIETINQGVFTFERSVEGGGYMCHKGYLGEEEINFDGTKIKAKHSHGQDDNLSGWLLSQTGLLGKWVKKNKKGVTRSLSFRDLARLIIVQEDEIIKRDSPFLTGQYTTGTGEFSSLKLLLTGVDDSALVAEAVEVKDNVNVEAKVELIDQWLEDLHLELADIGIGRNEAEEQLGRLDKSINTERERLVQIQANLGQFIDARRKLFTDREKIKNRINEIHELHERFGLLRSHYKIDLERLNAIQESGSLFVHQEKTFCPLCGAAPEDQHIDESCEGDVETVVQAAGVEIEKIKRLSRELNQTVEDLLLEATELSHQLVNVEERYQTVDNKIRESISPEVGDARAVFSELVDRRGEARKIFDIFDRVQRLEKQKTELTEEHGIGESGESSHTDLSKTLLDELATQIEQLLKVWHFPGANRVYFDEKSVDFVIDGKPRGSRGKGLRAITHAAVTIGLMEYCKKKNLPHPGFVVLDSPLMSYWGPEGKEDSLEGTDLKDRFYEYLVKEHSDSQIIIIENEHPSKKLLDRIAYTDFTKNPQKGRYGFFPYKLEKAK